MSKRHRKKHRLGELQQLGFELGFELRCCTPDDRPDDAQGAFEDAWYPPA